MSFRKRKAAAGNIVVVYAFITVTFPLAHKDFVPLENGFDLIPINNLYHALDLDHNDFLCPAHNFAQSTHGAGVESYHILAPQNFSFIWIEQFIQYVSAPSRLASTRAPPQTNKNSSF